MSDDATDRLLWVAREIIEKKGYLGLSMRTAAAAAGVTPEVARRYYRNRDALFAAALRLPVDPAAAIPALVAPGLEGMGERLVRFTLDVLRDPQAREDLMSLARTGVTAGQAALGVQDLLERGVIDRVAGAIGVPDARMRSALISSYLLGIAMTRYVIRLDPLSSASDEEVIRMVAPVIQDLLDPRKPIPGSARARAAGRATTPRESTERESGAASAGTTRPAGASPGRPGAPEPATAPPPPSAPHVFDPDPNRSSTSSVDMLGAGAATLGASALRAAAGALRVSSAAAAAARAAAPVRGADAGHGPGVDTRHRPHTPQASAASPAEPATAAGPRATDRSAAASPARPAPPAGSASPTPATSSTAAASPARTAPATASGAKAPTKRSSATTPATKTPAEKAAAKAPAQKAAAKKSPAKKAAAKAPATRTSASPPTKRAASGPATGTTKAAGASATSDRAAAPGSERPPVGAPADTALQRSASEPSPTPKAAGSHSGSVQGAAPGDSGV